MTKRELLELSRANFTAGLMNLEAAMAEEQQAPAKPTCPKHPGAPIKLRSCFGGEEQTFCSECGDEVTAAAQGG